MALVCALPYRGTVCRFCQPRGAGEGGCYSKKNWVGVCGPLLKTRTLFMTKICDIPAGPTLLSPDQNFETLYMTRPLHQNPVLGLSYN